MGSDGQGDQSLPRMHALFYGNISRFFFLMFQTSFMINHNFFFKTSAMTHLLHSPICFKISLIVHSLCYALCEARNALCII